MAPSGLLDSFLAAVQASLSVLLVIFYGVIAARLKLLDSANGKAISKICVRMFLPALLLTKVGSELHAGSAGRYGIILAWAFICHILSFLIGIAAHLLFGFPDWITAAIMFNNSTSYPLLLIQSLDETGILGLLIVTDESTRDAIERAKSYFLVYATVSSCLTFAVGPRLMDSEHAPEHPDDKEDDEISDDEEAADNEESPLVNRGRLGSVASVSFFPSQPKAGYVEHNRRPTYISKKKWLDLHPTTKWWLLFLYDFLNAPLIGAVLGVIIGLTPALHRAFFNSSTDGGIFTAWLTASWKNVGAIFVPLPLIVAGISLYTSYTASKRDGAAEAPTPWLTVAFVLFIRFVIWPVVSIGTIYALAKKTDILGSDPMLWFTLMLMPVGPSALKLITMIQVSDADEADEHKVTKLLTISYVISPILAFTVVGALQASQAAIAK